jgi:hypothetical protein
MGQSESVVKRAFLNTGKSSGLAAISSEFYTSYYNDDPMSADADAWVKISDCNRVVELDLSCDMDTVDEKIAKAKVIIDIFNGMVKLLEKYKKEHTPK